MTHFIDDKEAKMQQSLDENVLNDWFAVTSIERLDAEIRVQTVLLGQPIIVWRDKTHGLHANERMPDNLNGREFAVQQRHGFIWVSLGAPRKELFALPEFDEPGRRFINAGTFGVKSSGLRVIENFLDMGHFPYVHTDILGKDPHSEVPDYKVTTDPQTGEIWATECRFWQPKAAASAAGGLHVAYTYRITQPFTAVLYKTCPTRTDARDVIGVYVQPISEDECRATLWLLLFDDVATDAEIIGFQQTIFAQDRPILENQVPKRLPLDMKSEVPARADAGSTAYRRWLRQIGMQYGVHKTA
ncbi:aromatic ring-hydroxylating dioxygenase subunit alpha [Herbaspirillum sp. GCM10030257]|uniref:aromatic ring-hydroxylating dioxygenase subunit alpha n=1 Tax=Herbaspirillum sp. GCM10030257 TaxID=3273393 RepID=UPI00360AF878